MSVLISLHAASLGDFLKKIHENRNVHICDACWGFRILHALNLTGTEQRPFTDAEIKLILHKYQYFRDFFTKKGLWPKEY